MGLSPTEKERLLHRPTNSRDRATNDVRVRKKLAAWLKDIPDMELIFRHLPEPQLAKELKDDDAFLFLEFAEKIMECLEFGPIEGKIENPEEWKVVIDENNQRPANDIDIARSHEIDVHINKLTQLRGELISRIRSLSKLDAIPGLGDRITKEERESIKIVSRALLIHMIAKGKIHFRIPGPAPGS
jgi:hypothetical protein